MFNVLQIIYDNSKDVYYLPNNRLVFELSRFEIVFDLDNSFTLGEDSFYLINNLDDLQRLSEVRILDCFIASSEYLGYRTDIIDYTEPSSISLQSLNLQNEILKIDERAISRTLLSLNYGYDDVDPSFCDTEPNYLFEIHLTHESLINIEFFERLIKHSNQLSQSTKPPLFYWIFYKKNQNLPDSHKPKFLITNTKTRRIGYLKILGHLLDQKEKIGATTISKKLEDYASDFNNQLEDITSNKGLIKKTKNGISAKPYIKLATDLELINVLNNIYSKGKLLKVYNVLKEQYADENNVFKLGKFDKLFFLELILKKDYQYLSVLMEILRTNKNVNYSSLTKVFQSALIARFEENIDKLSHEKKKVAPLKSILKRISEWEKPEVYLEHVLMPRLNWLTDLELINLDNRLNIELSKNGLRLIENFCCWNDINACRIISPKEFINRFMVHAFDHTYGFDSHSKQQDVSEIRSKTLEYINESFDYFQTLAPNRVTASQAIDYTKYRLYLENGFTVGHTWIANQLEGKDQSQFVYKYQKQYGDGYIQKLMK
ncbi:MAG: hypothetical protein RIC35_05465 [Marinoscillum sp.]